MGEPKPTHEEQAQNPKCALEEIMVARYLFEIELQTLLGKLLLNT